MTVTRAQGLRRRAFQRPGGRGLGEGLKSQELGFYVLEVPGNDALSDIHNSPNKSQASEDQDHGAQGKQPSISQWLFHGRRT